MKYIWNLPKKVNFPSILYWKETQKAQPNLFSGRFSFDLTFSACLLGNGLELGDNSIQIFHLGRYSVGYTVGNLVLRRRASGAVKRDFRTYIRRYTFPNENFWRYPITRRVTKASALESYFKDSNARNKHVKKVNCVCLSIGVTCNLANQVKQWHHYLWCWRHNMRNFWQTSFLYCFLKNVRYQSQNSQEIIVLLQWKYKLYQSLVKKYDTIFFHCGKIPIVFTFDMHWIHVFSLWKKPVFSWLDLYAISI